MSTVTGTITKVERRESPDRNNNIVYFLDVDTPQGKINRGYLAAKTYEPRQGEQITVEVRKGQYGPMLKRVVEQQTSSSQGGRPPDQRFAGRRDANGRSIERQVALKAAVEYANNSGREVPISAVLDFAQEFDDFLANSARPVSPDPHADQAAAKRADSGSQDLTDPQGIPF